MPHDPFVLPCAPVFPVFGLDEGVPGYRWLDGWSSDEHLYLISLAQAEHRPERSAPPPRSTIAITTIRKTPLRVISRDPYLASCPTGFLDGLWHALLGLISAELPPRAAAQWVADEINGTDHGDDERNAPVDLGPDWTVGSVLVAGTPHPTRDRTLGAQRARLLDLPAVAVLIQDHAGTAAVQSIIDVRATIGRYGRR